MKKGITIAIISLIVIGVGIYLFKISPQETTSNSSGYNAALDISAAKPLTQPVAFDKTTDHYLGNADAKNVFIEFGDLECPYCAQYNDMLKQVTAQFPDTVFVFRYFPLVQIHKNSVESALAAEAAGAQGKYWEMHDLMFQKQGDWEGANDPIDLFAQYAQQVGVKDINQFKSDITSKKYLPKIEQDNNQANGLQMGGTPTYYFNGHLIQTATTIDGLKQEAQQYLNK